MHHDSDPVRCLDDRARALVGLGALLAIGGGAAAYRRSVAEALDAGLTPDEIVDSLITVAPIVGLAQLVPATMDLASALDYDIDHALEDLDGGRSPP